MHPEKRAKIGILLFILVAAFVSNSRAGSDSRTIDTARLHSIVVNNVYSFEAGREQQFTVIDARSEEEYNEAHMVSANSMPVKDFEKLNRFLPKDKGAFIAVYDNDINSGAGMQWSDKAAAAGYTNVAVYSEGFQAWKKKQLPIVVSRDSLE